MKRAVLALSLPLLAWAQQPAQAALLSDEAREKLSVFGEVQVRAERDERQGDTYNVRRRFQYRANIGSSYKVDDSWMGQIRLSTLTDSSNTPFINFSSQESNNGSFGVDQAFIKWTPVTWFNAQVGRSPINYWQQSEVMWDKDINTDSIGFTARSGGFSFNVEYFVLDYAANEWSSEDNFVYIASQFLYEQNFGELGLTAALGRIGITDEPEPYYRSERHNQFAFQLRYKPVMFGADYIKSDADIQNTAWHTRLRYNITSDVGIQLYKYHVEAHSVMQDGMRSQDNFPRPDEYDDPLTPAGPQPNLGGVSNFEGYRIGLDYRLNTNTSIDMQYYKAWRLVDRTNPADLPKATISTALMTEPKQDRFQLNVNFRF